MRAKMASKASSPKKKPRPLAAADYVVKTGKMSKQLRNYRSPQEIFDKYGADALRWYLCCQSSAVELDSL
jgi:leucyl-tRNA synthetase